MRLAAILVIAVIATQAHAAAPQKTWFILSGTDNQCHPARQVMPSATSPEAFHRAARARGMTDDINVTKDDDGTVTAVTTSIEGQDGLWIWFPDQQRCQIALDLLRERGAAPNMDELK